MSLGERVLYNQTGELVEIYKGVGVTRRIGSDSSPYTVQEIKVSKTGKVTIFVTPDLHTPVEGFDFYTNQKYIYTSQTDLGLEKIKLGNKNTRNWFVGARRYYQDPSF